MINHDRLLGFLEFYPRDPFLLDLVHKKRVALVGPSGSLVGSGHGPTIDAYDLVVRMNMAAKSPPEPLAADYGRRMDAIWLSEVVLQRRFALEHDRVTRFYPALKLSVVAAQGLLVNHAQRPPFLYPGCEWFHPGWQDWWPTIETTEVRMVTDALFFYRELLGGAIPRAGVVAILDLLLHGPAELHLAGMTFYQIAIEPTDIYGEWWRPNPPPPDPHDAGKEWALLKWLWREFPGTMTADSVLQSLLEG